MKGRLLLLAMSLPFAACLNRNTVGAEPGIDSSVDAGLFDDAAMALPSPIEALEEQLFGVWKGEWSFDRGEIELNFAFKRDHTMTGCIGDNCLFDGDYRVTDVLSDGTGIVQGRRSEDGTPFRLENVAIQGDVLRFRAFPGNDFRLRRVTKGASAAGGDA